jgi:beta-lactamase regulating signal transducer with metallopeptidase domain
VSYINVLSSAATGLLAVLVTLVICRLRMLHPALKTWICRLVMAKLIAGLFLGAAVPVSGTPPSFISPVLVAYLVIVWLAGALVVVWHGVQAYREADRMRRLSAPCAPIAEAPRLPVRKLRALPEPCIVGVFRPVLLVPEQADLDPLVIRHELAHVRHLDSLFGMFAWLVYALFWFVPGLGRLLTEHALWQEAWADLDARSGLRLSAAEQAQSLLGALSRNPEVPAASLSFRGDANLVSRRIEAMFSDRYSVAIAVVVVVVTLILALPIRLEAAGPASGSAVSPASIRSIY